MRLVKQVINCITDLNNLFIVKVNQQLVLYHFNNMFIIYS